MARTTQFPTDLPGLPKFKQTGRPPRNRSKAPVFPKGPRHLRLGSKPGHTGGPGEPPAGFITAHNSSEEWWVYWGFATLYKDPPNPRIPPFTGGLHWGYQRPEAPTEGGMGIGRVAGGSVSDFVIEENGTSRVVRLQTERFHIFASPTVQERDFGINVHLRGVEDVIDIYSQDFLEDETGATLCKILALAIKGIQWLPPTGARTALRTRKPR